MILHLRNSEIDKAKWDKTITASPQGSIYAQSWYLDIVSPGWEALTTENYESLFPLTSRQKFGMNYLYQPGFTQQLGLFTQQKIIPSGLVSEFLNAVPEKFRLIEIQLNESNDFESLPGFQKLHRLTHHLDLSATPEKIFSNYSDNLKRNIRKAQSSGFTVDQNIPTAEIINLFRKNRGGEITTLNNKDYETLERLVAKAREHQLAESRGINVAGQLIAGAVFIKSLHSYIFLFSAVGTEARKSGAMSLIINSFINDHSGEQMVLDFEGSMDSNLARFYKSFGSQEIVYLQIRKNNLPLIIRWLKQLN